ncbi:MAG TPA: endolytic transglycosylase MltG [Candidatus Paceibacterota bacterium]
MAILPQNNNDMPTPPPHHLKDSFLAIFHKTNTALISHRFSHAVNRRIAFLAAIFFVIFSVYFFFFHPPRNFPVKQFIELPEGVSVKEAAKILDEKGVIKSSLAFESIYRFGFGLFGGEEKLVIKGNYFFIERMTLLKVIYHVSTGNYGIDHIKITIPEGLNLRQMANVLGRNLPNFNRGRFLLLTKGQEGYLFPDTYFFSPSVSERDIVKEMKQNFEDKIAHLKEDMAESQYSEEEIIVMASILEKEGITSESRKIISGILWKRIETGMKLQVDAVFPFIFGKNTFDLTRADLKFDSPYNTYLYEGLPPGPIASPSLDSIEAALYPEPNDYWFYLSDYNSEMHYARTYDEHLRFRKQFLGK